jgi:hypothetical protein
MDACAAAGRLFAVAVAIPSPTNGPNLRRTYDARYPERRRSAAGILDGLGRSGLALCWAAKPCVWHRLCAERALAKEERDVRRHVRRHVRREGARSCGRQLFHMPVRSARHGHANMHSFAYFLVAAPYIHDSGKTLRTHDMRTQRLAPVGDGSGRTGMYLHTYHMRRVDDRVGVTAVFDEPAVDAVDLVSSLPFSPSSSWALLGLLLRTTFRRRRLTRLSRTRRRLRSRKRRTIRVSTHRRNRRRSRQAALAGCVKSRGLLRTWFPSIGAYSFSDSSKSV